MENPIPQMDAGTAATPLASVPPLPPKSQKPWPPTPGLRRWLLIAETPLRQSPKESGAVLEVLKAGEEVDFMGLEKVEGKKWCHVGRFNGQRGYMPGSTPIRALKLVRLDQETAELKLAGVGTTSTRTLQRGDTFLVIQTVKTQAGDCVAIRTADGQEGLVDGKTRIKRDVIRGRNSAQRDMLIGGLWCAGGMLVTVLTYSAAVSGGGTYFVAWGAIVFGAIQFGRGLFRLASKG